MMKKFNEWRSEVDQIENPDILIKKLHGLVHELEVQLDAFQGERFEGFLNIIGGVRSLQRSLAEIETGCVGDTPKFTTSEGMDGKPSAPRGMKKIGNKEVISKGVRSIGKSDLSADYKGHIGMNGEVEPFELVKKGKKK